MTDDARGLLPCPFCGVAPLYVKEYGEYTCNDRQCPGWHVSEVPDRWNRRANLAAPAPDQWVKCSERLPDNSEIVLVYQPDASTDQRTAFYLMGRWCWPMDASGVVRCNPKMWQPLPPLPKEEK